MSDRQLVMAAVSTSFVALLTSGVALFKGRVANKAARRFLCIEEQIVRSVMEEQGTAYSDAVLRTTERLVGQGMTASGALVEARRIHRRDG